MNVAIANLRTARQHGVAFDPAEIGFEFSKEEVERREQGAQFDAFVKNGRYYE